MSYATCASIHQFSGSWEIWILTFALTQFCCHPGQLLGSKFSKVTFNNWVLQTWISEEGHNKFGTMSINSNYLLKIVTISIFKLFFTLELLCVHLSAGKNKSTNQRLLRVLYKGCYTFSLIKWQWLIKLYSFFNKGYLKVKDILNDEKLRLKKISSAILHIE